MPPLPIHNPQRLARSSPPTLSVSAAGECAGEPGAGGEAGVAGGPGSTRNGCCASGAWTILQMRAYTGDMDAAGMAESGSDVSRRFLFRLTHADPHVAWLGACTPSGLARSRW